jgi:HEAT repeat protein
LNIIDRLQGWLAALRSQQQGAEKLSHSEQEALVQQLASDRPAERWLAAEALAASNLTAAARHALTAALTSVDPILCWEASAALARGGSPAARYALLEALAAADPALQATAADALGLWPAEPETLVALTSALASQHAIVRQSAAEALARIAAQPVADDAPAPGQESVPALLDLLEADLAAMVRRAAALALGRIGDPATREPLEARQDDPSENRLVREAATVALTRLRAVVPEPAMQNAPGAPADEPESDAESAPEPTAEVEADSAAD